MMKQINLSPQNTEGKTYDSKQTIDSRAFKVLRRSVDGLSSELTVQAGQIALKASQSSVDSLSGRVTTTESTIVVQAGQIALKVSSTDYNGTTLVSMINILPDTIKIAAKNLVLSGLVTFNNLSNSGETSINGGNIIADTISANKINVTNLSSISASLGSITGGSINIGSGNFVVTTGGTVTIRSGTLGNVNFTAFSGNGVQISGPTYITGLLTLSTGGLQSTGAVCPTGDGDSSVGTSALTWGSIWAVDTTINASDRRLKKDIQPIEKGVELILKSNPVQYRWKQGERLHYGLIAQDMKDLMKQVGIKDAGLYVDANIKDGVDKLAIRYSELIAPMIQTIQFLYQKIEALENAR